MPRLVAFLLLTAFSLAQTAPAPATKKPRSSAAPATSAGKPATAAKKQAKAAEAGPNTIVLYVSGLCALPVAGVPAKPVPTAPPAQCVRSVTKAQFERMVAGMGPEAANGDKRQLAEYYMRALLIDNESRKLKLDQDPATSEAIWMGRVGVVGKALHRHFQKQFGNISDADIQKFYDANQGEFEEATVRRVVIPKPQQQGKVEKPAASEKSEAAPDSPSATKSAQPGVPEVPYEQQLAQRKTYADKVLERARAGEDPVKLQKEAFAAAKLDVEADTNAVPLHRGQLPPAHDEKIFATKAGDVTPMIEEPNAYLFYKVEKKRTVPLTEAREEIKTQLIGEKEEEAIKRVFSSGKPVLNPAYFRPPEPEAPPKAEPPATEEPKKEQPKAETPKTEAQPPAEQPKQESAPPAEPEKPQPDKPKTEAPAEPPK